MSAEWSEGATHAEPLQFFHGTINPLLPGTTLGRGAVSETESDPWLDTARPAGTAPRSGAIWAARSVRDATAMAAIRAYSPKAAIPHEAIRVYRVELAPSHTGPLAVIQELQRRPQGGRIEAVQALIREYWKPTGTWHIQEVIASSLTILEEVSSTSERDVYVRRWVQYNQDRARAEAL